MSVVNVGIRKINFVKNFKEKKYCFTAAKKNRPIHSFIKSSKTFLISALIKTINHLFIFFISNFIFR